MGGGCGSGTRRQWLRWKRETASVTQRSVFCHIHSENVGGTTMTAPIIMSAAKVHIQCEYIRVCCVCPFSTSVWGIEDMRAYLKCQMIVYKICAGAGITVSLSHEKCSHHEGALLDGCTRLLTRVKINK
jgi:hypothetical protein